MLHNSSVNAFVDVSFLTVVFGDNVSSQFQVLVQRALGAKNHIQARAGTIFAGFLKILPMFVMVMPGMISRVLFPNSIACPDPESCKLACDNKWGCSNNAYPK